VSRIALDVESLSPNSRDVIGRPDWGYLAGLSLGGPDEADLILASSLTDTINPAQPKPTLLTTEDLDATTASLAGVSAIGRAPFHELRIRGAAGHDQQLAHADTNVTLLLKDSPTLLSITSEDVITFYSFAIGLKSYPVFTYRPSTGVALSALGNDPAIWQDPGFLRLMHKFIHQIATDHKPRPIKVGLIGFGAIGNEHSSRIAAVEGMSITQVCDTSPERLNAALLENPGAHMTKDAEQVLESDVDVVIVSTPPNSHAALGLRSLEAGKNVVLEKPMALTIEQCDEMLGLARKKGLLLSVYQNRRWDEDFLLIRQAINGGHLGEVFRIETFVGGYSHPCNFWHSDQDVSGGAIFDWGSHLIDQMLQIAPAPVASVSATNLKRVWHDVTNADHSIVNIRFTNGATAEFTHSDIAAALKPRWYILGTKGALVGNWRTERVITRTPIGTLNEDVLAPADSPPQVQLYKPGGSVMTLRPEPQDVTNGHTYHQELADYLHFGLPMSIKPEQSRDVIAIMQAAEQSAAAGGVLIVPEI